MEGVRNSSPRALFKSVVDAGFEYIRVVDGIYRLSGPTLFDIQIVVTAELKGKEYLHLKAMTTNISRDMFSEYVEDYSKRCGKERELADIILQIITSSNYKVIREWKGRDEFMCEALLEIMADEIEERKEAAQREGRAEGRELEIFTSVREGDYSIERGAEKLGL